MSRLLFLTGAPGDVLTPVSAGPRPPTPPSTTSAPRLNPRPTPSSYCRTRATGRHTTTTY
eukprot:4262403-Prymnesium_polylepis.1